MAADGFLMLGILANYHKYEARNAMLVRFEDLVDEGIMRRVREAASLSLLQARKYVRLKHFIYIRLLGMFPVPMWREWTTRQPALSQTLLLWSARFAC
jgi:hypothetical protein